MLVQGPAAAKEPQNRRLAQEPVAEQLSSGAVESLLPDQRMACDPCLALVPCAPVVVGLGRFDPRSKIRFLFCRGHGSFVHCAVTPRSAAA
jgi:hypothetical protein